MHRRCPDASGSARGMATGENGRVAPGQAVGTGGGARSCNLMPDLAHTYMHKVVQYEAGNRGSRKEMGTSPSH
jgi:hypothetical protein